jgi:hypothetical protein
MEEKIENTQEEGRWAGQDEDEGCQKGPSCCVSFLQGYGC